MKIGKCENVRINLSIPAPSPSRESTALPLVIFLHFIPENDRGKEPAQVKRLKAKS